MPSTRRGSLSLCRKRTREESSGQCYDSSHIKLIANLKREILELDKSLNAEREQRIQALRKRPALCTSCICRADKRVRGVGGGGGEEEERLGSGRVAVDAASEAVVSDPIDANRYAVHELESCKRELDDTTRALHEACEEREALRIKLSESQTGGKITSVHAERGGGTSEGEAAAAAADSHHTSHLDWVGRHYLAVSLPDDCMFRPGQSVTPLGVLQKLFEMRVGDKLATGFGLLLENINIMLSQLEPEWYAKHFGFRSVYVHGNGYKATDRVPVEDFAWLLFEYEAHAPLIEVLAALLNVANSTGKGGVTTAALYTGKSMYCSYVTLFRDTVSRAHRGFVRVRERAERVRRSQGVVHVPLTAGLVAEQSDSQGGSRRAVRNRVLRSILEGIEAPPHHIGVASTSTTADVDRRVSREDPLRLGQSLSAFMKRRGLDVQDKGGKSSVHRSNNNNNNNNNQESLPFKGVMSDVMPAPLEKRVLFDPPW